MPVLDILLPIALDQTYSYRSAGALAPGTVVRVPLGKQEAIGVVWDAPDGAGMRGDNLKEIIAPLDWPAMAAPLRRFIDRLSQYTLQPRGMVMRMALRNPDAEADAERPILGVRLTGKEPSRPTPARLRVVEAASGGVAWRKTELSRQASVSTGVIDGLIDDGVLETFIVERRPVARVLDPAFFDPKLSPEQAEAAEALRQAVRERRFSATLLEGVTGSGKTEVYFEAVGEALRQGRQSLILLPEIALTAEFLARFAARFGDAPCAWHSHLGEGRRGRAYKAIADGEVMVVAGARSALMLPYRDLGLIIIDEEHEAAYKQDDGVSYHARDMGVLRASIEGAAVMLASATPSIESRVNADRGRYQHLLLPQRHAGRPMPKLEAVDLRRDGPKRGEWIAPRVEAEIRAVLERGEQALLFLNRRGFAPLTLCRACGHRWQCPNCSASLVDHRFRRALVCHHCGHTERRPPSCTECGTEDSLAACGPGIERLAEEAAQKFPDYRRISLSSDFPGGTERLKQELEAVASGEFPLVIGTQLIAKGHNFPNVTLAVVIDADVGLASGDPRAGERTFQLLQQVTGRAGRGDKPGRGLLQSYQPDHPVLKALLSGNTERFYAEEIAQRREAELPPFGRMAGLIVSGADKAETEKHARALALAAHGLGSAAIRVLGPAEAPIAMIRGRHRIRLLLRGPREADIQGFIRNMLAAAPKPRGSVRVAVDIDPMNFM
jgi:primosomal protein N' (replication factor Y) (superfamily II helicase)